MTFFQTRVPLSLNIVNIMQPYQFGKYKTNTSTCYNNNITLGLDHKLFKKTRGILSCYNPSLHIYIHISHTHSVLPCPSLGIIFLIAPLDWVQEAKAAQVCVPSLLQLSQSWPIFLLPPWIGTGVQDIHLDGGQVCIIGSMVLLPVLAEATVLAESLHQIMLMCPPTNFHCVGTGATIMWGDVGS